MNQLFSSAGTRVLLLHAFMTVSAAAQITVDFPAVQDTWVNQNNATKQYGGRTTMTIRDGDIKIPYLQFQPFGITGSVTNARLYFRIVNANGLIEAHDVPDQTWVETDVTYNTRPAFNASASGSVDTTSTAANSWVFIDVTSTITGNGLSSFALRCPASDNINGTISTKEDGFAPYLQITYADQNLPPEGVPESYAALYNTLRTVTEPGVLSNDSDPNDDPLTAQLVTSTNNGTLNLATDGSFTYMPDADFSGTDSFVYRAVDDHAGNSLQSTPITVTITVNSGGNQFTDDELARFQQDLGVTLTVDQQLELAAIVKPTATDPWRADADARIEQHRKSSLAITVVDSNGIPLQGAEVQIRLKRKTFLFGGVLDLNEFSLGATGGVDAATYRSLAPPYFDSVGLNNGLKPKLNATNTTNLNRLNNEFFPWCTNINMPVRGHLLMWPGGTHMSATVDAKVVEIETTDTPTQTQLDELRTLVDAEISDWAALWDVYEWDVVNETIANHRIQDILGQSEIVRWFNLANTANPNTGRLINEYQIISGNNENRFPAYKAEIQYLIDNNAPLTAIGFQSRFKFKHEAPATVYSRLEQFAGYNKDLVGTEFEIISSPDQTFIPDENLRALMTEEIMTTYFSHPKVTGLSAWEYLSESPSALVSNDGSPKLNGLVWYYLNRLRYDTRATLTTDALGQISLSAFKGDYEITVTTTGEPVVETLTLSGDSTIQIGTSIATSTSHTLDVIEDTFVGEGGNADSNFGNNAAIQLRSPDGTVGRIGYLKFDTSSVAGSILSAKLRLYSVNEPHSVDVMPVSDSTWVENGVGGLTWNTRPATGAVIGSGLPPETLPASFDIELDPTALTTGALLSLAIGETGNSFGTLASSENTSSYPTPQLILITGSPDTDSDGILDTLDPDDDNDGLPDDWEILYGLNSLDQADRMEDPDKDGIPSFIEFALAMNPTTAESLSTSFRIEDASAVSFKIVIRRRTGTHSRAVFLDHSLTLGDWASADLANLPAAGFTLLDQTTSFSSDASGTIETTEFLIQNVGNPRHQFRLAVE